MAEKIEGKVLVSWKGILQGKVMKFKDSISFLGDINPKTGKPIERLDPRKRSISNKILFFPGSKGSTVGSAVLYGLAKRKKAPRVLVTPQPELITMGGAIFGEIPMLEISKTQFKRVLDGQKAKAYIEEGKRGIIELTGS